MYEYLLLVCICITTIHTGVGVHMIIKQTHNLMKPETQMTNTNSVNIKDLRIWHRKANRTRYVK